MLSARILFEACEIFFDEAVFAAWFVCRRIASDHRLAFAAIDTEYFHLIFKELFDEPYFPFDVTRSGRMRRYVDRPIGSGRRRIHLRSCSFVGEF